MSVALCLMSLIQLSATAIVTIILIQQFFQFSRSIQVIQYFTNFSQIVALCADYFRMTVVVYAYCFLLLLIFNN